ncbi:MAG TPA: hypothetical protein VMS45_03750 [Gemmatimonadaceae bacterium]|nr:hypothetical protein [Gemmatimonadaceae bacterium]
MKILVAALTAAALSLGALGARAYHVATTFVLGGDGGWDYVAFDTLGQRLFIARATRVMVVRPETGKVIAEIPNIGGAHGIAIADEFGHGFATGGRDSSVTMFDLKSLAILRKVTAAPDADAVLYDPVTKRVFTFNGDSKSSSVFDAKTGDKVGTIDLKSGPEFGVSDFAGKLYVNLEDEGAIAEIDARAMTVTRRWPLAPCKSPTGLAIDRERHLLFSGCRSKVMAISDAAAGKLLTTVPIGAGVDAAVYDADTKLAFASNGDGTLSVLSESGGQWNVATVQTMPGARTMALDPKTHRIFTVSAKFGPAPAATPGNERPRPPVIPGTFSLLVLDP